MSLKCSVFGHQFGDADITREREENDSEVVITITETETCERCGETRVVSENKEVTTLETPDVAGDETDSGDEDEGGDGVEEVTGSHPLPDHDPGGPSVPTADTDPDSDDAVILDDEDEGREPGEWPEEAEETEEGDDWAPGTDAGDFPPVEEEQPDVEPAGEAVSVPEGEFYCPECGFTTAVESSSLREGDFCPECSRGSLVNKPGE
jgi:ssDNA-binding Zn-finger/Zn-ribbon topoisomerase 1